MASRVGIIPAGGSAYRFGGLQKELLPARDGRSFLWHAVQRLPDVDCVVVVTNAEKIAAHARELGAGVVYMMSGGADLWRGGILPALAFGAEEYLFTMPDTLLPEGAFLARPAAPFALGTFPTDKPGRFGVLLDGKVIDKDASLPVPATAWGVLAWNYAAVQLWERMRPENYTQAINQAIDAFGLHTWDIGWYHDNASIADYLEYMHQ